MTNTQLKALIDQGVGAALLERDADRSRNGEDSHDSGFGGRRLAPTARECTLMTSNNVYFIASFIPLIMEYLVNISKRRAFWRLNEDYCSNYQHAVSIKEDMANKFRMKQIMIWDMIHLMLHLLNGWDQNFFNYKTMDHHTMKALWIYWIRGDDEVELTDDEISDNEDGVSKVFRIDTNIFDFETPMCKTFKEFNYLLQINPDLLTKDIEGFKLMKNITMIGSMNGTKIYHGLTRNHGLTLEFGLNPHHLRVIVNPSIIKLDVQNGQHVVGRMMVTAMEETYLELTYLETSSITKIMNVIMEYLVNISKRRAFWSLNEDILKITVLTTNTPYPSRKIRLGVGRGLCRTEVWGKRVGKSVQVSGWEKVAYNTRYAISTEVDTAYWAGFLETAGIRHIGNWSNAFSCEVLRKYAVSLQLDTAYW
uniref:Uncharacterized protein n=1 Tax=Tanacetum cinerariifolium TaxID=118510 RepID=A0A6L2KI27_TANCI|nr:hypothetical protein [Tanacetum cinerariifolium]